MVFWRLSLSLSNSLFSFFLDGKYSCRPFSRQSKVLRSNCRAVIPERDVSVISASFGVTAAKPRDPYARPASLCVSGPALISSPDRLHPARRAGACRRLFDRVAPPPSIRVGNVPPPSAVRSDG